jgi:hypothetical protein
MSVVAARFVTWMHDALEAERQAIAARRYRDPIIANAVTGLGLRLARHLPLVMCWYLIQSVHDEQNDVVVTEILIAALGSENQCYCHNWLASTQASNLARPRLACCLSLMIPMIRSHRSRIRVKESEA